MGAHVGQVAVAKRQPAAPVQTAHGARGGEVVVLVRQQRRRAAPEVPVQPGGDRVGVGVDRGAGREAARDPAVDLADLAQQARLNQLHAAAEGVGRAALRAELRGQFALPAQLADLACLDAAMGHRLLAEDVLAGQHGGLAQRHVPSLAGGDDHRIYGLLRLEQLAVVLVDLGSLQLDAVAFLQVGDLPSVNVAHSHDLVALLQGRAEDLAHPPAAAKQGQVQPAVGSFFGQCPRGHEARQCTGRRQRRQGFSRVNAE